MGLLEKYYAYRFDNEAATIEEQIAFDIIKDLTDRGGLDNEWDSIDNDIKEEIIGKWIGLVKAKIPAAITPVPTATSPAKEEVLMAIKSVRAISSELRKPQATEQILIEEIDKIEAFVKNTITLPNTTLGELIKVTNPELSKEIDEALNPEWDLYLSKQHISNTIFISGKPETGIVSDNGIEKEFTFKTPTGVKPPECFTDWEFIGTFKKLQIKKDIYE